jgi:hypothetical protein
MAKVSALLWLYVDLNKVMTSEVSVCDDLDRHGLLRSGAAQGRQPWVVEVETDLTGVKSTAERCK